MQDTDLSAQHPHSPQDQHNDGVARQQCEEKRKCSRSVLGAQIKERYGRYETCACEQCQDQVRPGRGSPAAPRAREEISTYDECRAERTYQHGLRPAGHSILHLRTHLRSRVATCFPEAPCPFSATSHLGTVRTEAESPASVHRIIPSQASGYLASDSRCLRVKVCRVQRSGSGLTPRRGTPSPGPRTLTAGLSPRSEAPPR